MHDLDHTDRTDTSPSGYRLHLTSPTWTHGPAGAVPAPTASAVSSAPQYHLWRPLPPGSGDLESLRRERPERRTGAWTLIEADDGLVRLTTDRTRSHHLLFARAGEQQVVDAGVVRLPPDRPLSPQLFSPRAGDTWVISDDPEELRRHAPTWVRDEEAAEVFLHAGFTPGRSSTTEPAGVA